MKVYIFTIKFLLGWVSQEPFLRFVSILVQRNLNKITKLLRFTLLHMQNTDLETVHWITATFT